MLYHMVCPAHSHLPQSPGAALALGYSSPRASHQLYPIGRGLSPPPPFPGVEITRDQTLDLFSPPGPPWSDSTIKVGFLVPRRRASPVLDFGPCEIVRPGVQSCRTRPPQRSWVNPALPFPYSKSHNPCPVPVFLILLLVLHFHFCIPCLTPIIPFPLSLLYSCSKSQYHLPNPCPIFSVWFLFPYSLSHSNILVPSPIPGPSPIFSIPFPVPVPIPVPVPNPGPVPVPFLRAAQLGLAVPHEPFSPAAVLGQLQRAQGFGHFSEAPRWPEQPLLPAAAVPQSPPSHWGHAGAMGLEEAPVLETGARLQLPPLGPGPQQRRGGPAAELTAPAGIHWDTLEHQSPAHIPSAVAVSMFPVPFSPWSLSPFADPVPISGLIPGPYFPFPAPILGSCPHSRCHFWSLSAFPVPFPVSIPSLCP